MKYYVIINGNSSLDIQGLAIESLPNISKPLIRTTREEIDGRDGDIITKLGYSAYDKTLNIGLWGNYDINEVIAFFNEEGVITFSNEPDKYYKFHILNRIDFVNQLEKFKKASITIHCQPFKYKEQEAKVIEEEEHTTSGTSFNLSDTLEAPLLMDLKGNTSQTGTPTPSSPIPVNVVSGDNDIVVEGKNLMNMNNVLRNYYYSFGVGSLPTLNTATSNNRCTIRLENAIIVKPNTTYTISTSTGWGFVYGELDSDKKVLVDSGWKSSPYTFTTNANTKYLLFNFRNASNNTITDEQYNSFISGGLQLEEGSTATTYEPYTVTTYNIDLPVENLLENTLTSREVNNLTIVVNDDKTISINGTANAETTLTIGNIATLKANTYSLSGTPSTGASNTYKMQLTGAGSTRNETGSGLTFTTTTDYSNVAVVLKIYNGVQVNNLTFKPQLEIGSKINRYTPYGTTPIELCKIGTYKDRIFHAKDGDTYYDSLDSATKQTLTYDKWYLHKEIQKLVLNGSENGWTQWNSQTLTNTIYCGISILDNIPHIKYTGIINYFVNIETTLWDNDTQGVNINNTGENQIRFRINKTTASNLDNFKTWLSTHNTILYYVLATPTNTEITYTPLIEQLNTLEDAESYEGTTNINQVNNDLPFIIDLTYYTGDTSITITNDGNIYSKPLLELKGTGNINIYLNGIQVFVVSLNNEIIYIDTDKMEAYYQGTLKNRQVVGDYNNFKLQSGNNTIQVDGGYVEYLKITNYSRWV